MCKYHMLGLSGTVLTVVQSYRWHVWLIDSQRKLAPFFLHAQISVKAWEGMYLVTQRCPHTVCLLWRLPLDLDWPAKWTRGSESASLSWSQCFSFCASPAVASGTQSGKHLKPI